MAHIFVKDFVVCAVPRGHLTPHWLIPKETIWIKPQHVASNIEFVIFLREREREGGGEREPNWLSHLPFIQSFLFFWPGMQLWCPVGQQPYYEHEEHKNFSLGLRVAQWKDRQLFNCWVPNSLAEPPYQPKFAYLWACDGLQKSYLVKPLWLFCYCFHMKFKIIPTDNNGHTILPFYQVYS